MIPRMVFCNNRYSMEMLNILIVIALIVQGITSVIKAIIKLTHSNKPQLSKEDILYLLKNVPSKDDIITIVDKAQNSTTTHLINTLKRLMEEGHEELKEQLRDEISETKQELQQEIDKLNEKIAA